mgnify:CR=1 FL=1
MKTALKAFEQELDAIREAGTWREERIITTPQRSCIDTTQKSHVVNMCANNYLGLSDDPRLIEAAKASYDRWGFGLSSVRSSAARRRSTRSSSAASQSSQAPTTQSCIPPASTPTAVCLRRCLGRRTRLFRTN